MEVRNLSDHQMIDLFAISCLQDHASRFPWIPGDGTEYSGQLQQRSLEGLARPGLKVIKVRAANSAVKNKVLKP